MILANIGLKGKNDDKIPQHHDALCGKKHISRRISAGKRPRIREMAVVITEYMS